MITQCCACQKVRQGKRWVKAPDSFPKEERVSHGYCPSCGKEALKAVEAHYAELQAAGAAV